MGFLAWLENSGVVAIINESLWAYPIVLSCHAIGMAVVVGIVLMIDLRILGYARGIPIPSLERLFSVAWAGFFLNLLSGTLLFSIDATRFFFLNVFRIKILLIILGMISIRMLLGAVRSSTQPLTAEGSASGKTKLMATLSLIFWIGAIFAGRLIAYLE